MAVEITPSGLLVKRLALQLLKPAAGLLTEFLQIAIVRPI
jgi:hypothetical protein